MIKIYDKIIISLLCIPKVGNKTIDVRVFRMPEPVEKVIDKKAPEIEKAKWQKK